MFLLRTSLPLLLALIPACAQAVAQQPAEDQEDNGKPAFAGLELRSIGPALTGGRVTDFAVDPANPSRYFVALASGGVWYTENAGTTYKAVFENEGSYSIGCVTLDPGNRNVIWVGSGENNSQRSVSFGDGVYRSLDGGKHWQNMGLKESEHIGKILVDPRDSDTVFVAAQGPLWRDGGDRGLYKSNDGGLNWRKVLEIDEHTGVNEVHFDPRDPDVLYASSYQRRRHVWTLINGGPGSGLWKSTDGGENWRKLKHGLPKVDMGRIGLGVSPLNPDYVYAIAEAADGKGGFFRSTDRGETWEKRSSTMTSSPQYYNEVLCDPADANKVYLLDTFLQVTEDGGKTFSRVPARDMHVDHHALWINPEDPRMMMAGNDGGVYRSYDGGHNWQFHANLPVAQYYRVSVDEQAPFYYVYGGTQDNNSHGGPSNTTSRGGIFNEDWFVTVGGDGYETIADLDDNQILYSLWQYGGLVRHDRRSGEVVDIKPRERSGDDPYRWNWDSPLMQSTHGDKSIYFAAQRVFRSADRGNTWEVISPDLSRSLDRNRLEVMGRVWGVDTVSKNRSTSPYGNIVALAESPLVEGLLYAGTDDGLIQVSEDGGASWRREDSFPGIPELAYVTYLTPSLHAADTVYASFHNHKMGDFKPYVLKSEDRGRSWRSIGSDLPERHFVWALAEDHVEPGLLFAGTEFGLSCTIDGGEHWFKCGSGLPTIAVRDLDIQRRESDLALATFGRSFYVLDDYSPLRSAAAAGGLGESVAIFPVRNALLYMERGRLGGRQGRGSQGASYYNASNRPFGATFTYFLPEKIRSHKEARQQKEKELRKDGGDVPYPSWEELRAEDEERAPQVWLIVKDDSGQVVRRLQGSRNKGVHRSAWDLREPSLLPVQLAGGADLPPWASAPRGRMVLPGAYSVTLAVEQDGALSEIGTPQSFLVETLDLATLATRDPGETHEFQRRVASLRRALRATLEVEQETRKRLDFLHKAITDTPGADPGLLTALNGMAQRLNAIRTLLNGDRTLSQRQEPTSPGLSSRINNVASNQWTTTNPPTATERQAYRLVSAGLEALLTDLRPLVEVEIPRLEAVLEAAGAPYTPGRRLPQWRADSN